MKYMLRTTLLFSVLTAFMTLSANAQNCTINAGVTTKICPGQSFILQGASSGLIAVNPKWSQVGGPAVTIVNPNSLTTAVAGYDNNSTYKFRLTATCTDGSLIYDEVTYTTYPATIANAGPDINACPGNTTSMTANAPGTNESGAWIIVGGSNGMTLNNASAATSTLNLPTTQGGTTTFQWTITNTANGCSSSDQVIVKNSGGITPVSAGSNQNLSNCYTLTQSTTLAGSYPGNVNGQQGTWSLVSGPNVPVFGNIHSNNTAINTLIPGTYVFRWTVSGPCVNGSDEVTVIVPAPTQAVSNAGGYDQTFCDGRTSATISGAAAVYAGETVMWTMTSGTGTITDPYSPTTTITGLDGHNSTFQYKITAPGGCTSTGTYHISFTSPPSMSTSTPILTPPCDAVTAAAAFSYTGGDETKWALISSPAGSALQTSVGLNNYNTVPTVSPLTVPGLDKLGSYVIRFRRTTNNGNGGCSDAYTDVRIVTSRTSTASNAGTRQVLACNVFNTNLAGNVPAEGIGSWSQISGPNTANIVNKADPTTAINGLINGAYTFRWIVTGNISCANQQSDVTVVVAAVMATASAAGTAKTVCNNTPVQLEGNTPVLNETGTWSVSPSAGVTFSNVNNPHAIVNGLAANTTYTFTWKIANACSNNSSSVAITTSAIAGPRQAAAGTDQCLPAGTTNFTLAGNVPLASEAGAWSFITGPNTPVITNNALYNTTVTGAQSGTYTFEWILSRGGCTVTRDTVMVTISGAATTASAGTNQQLCGATSYTLTGNTPTIGIGAWSQVEGPGGALITDATANSTSVTNLGEGRYVFRWTISNGACAANFADVKLDISAAPTTAVAGSDQGLCNVTSTTLAANTITVGTGLWSVVSGPSTPTIANSASPTTGLSNLKMGTYQLRWTSVNGPFCPASTSDVNITITQSAKATSNSQNLCNASATVLTGNEGSTGIWTQTSGPAATVSTNSGNSAIISNLLPGAVYGYKYTIPAVGACPATSDNVIITNSAPPSTAAGGADQSLCILNPATTAGTTLAATAPATGTGAWSIASKPTGSTATIVDPANPSTAFNNLTEGTYILEWNVTNGYCTANKDVVRIQAFLEPSNSVAGADQLNACSSQVTLTGNTPSIGLGTWSRISGASVASIDQPNSPTTKVLGAIPDIYTFQWTITNGTCAAKSSTVQVVVTSTPPTTPIANVIGTTPVQICNAGPTATYTLLGNNPGPTEVGTWSVLSSTGSTAIITSPNTSFSTITGMTEGTYLLQWAINRGSCIATDTFSIRVYDQPTTANASGPAQVCLYSPVALTNVAVTSGTGAWSVVSGPSVPVFTTSNATTTAVTGMKVGAYQFQFTTTNGVCASSTTYVSVAIEDCRVAVVKTASTPLLKNDGSYDVTFSIVVSNPGAVISLNNVQVTDNLQTPFPSPKIFTVKSLTATGSLSSFTNAAFNGKTDQNLLIAGATLGTGVSETITLTVNVKMN